MSKLKFWNLIGMLTSLLVAAPVPALAVVTNQNVQTISALGNASNQDFVIGFDFRDNTQIIVTRQDNSTTPPTQTTIPFGSGSTKFTITGGNPGTTVHMGTAPTATQFIIIQRSLPYTQSVSYDQAAPFPFASHETQMDDMIFILQQLHHDVQAKIGLAPTSLASPTPTLPDPVANNFLVYDPSDNNLQTIPGAATSLNTGDFLTFNGTTWTTTNYSAANLVTKINSGSTTLNPGVGGTGHANSGTLTWGSNNITFTTSGTTSLTLPTSGQLAVAGSGGVGSIPYGVDSGTGNAYVVAAPTPGVITSLVAGAALNFTTANANTGAATINVQSNGAVAIKDDNGNALSSGMIQAGAVNTVVYDGTVWRLTAPVATAATNVATTATTTNASFFPLLAASSSNSLQAPNLASALTYNPSTATLTATNFAGTATNATNGTTVATTTNASFFPLLAASSTNGNQAFNLSSSLTYNPSSGTLAATLFSGSGASLTSLNATNLSSGSVAAARGGTALDTSASTGVPSVSSGVWSVAATLAKTLGGTGQSNASLTFPSTGTVQAITPAAHGVLVSGSGATAAVTGAGTSGQVLTSNGASSDPTYQDVPSAPSFPDEMYNVGLANALSGSDLALSLKQKDGSTDCSSGSAACKVAIRSSTLTSGAYNERSVTASLSLTLHAGTALGAQTSTDFPAYIYLIDSDGSGTMKLAVSKVRLDETKLYSTIAEQFTTSCTQTSPTVCTSTAHGMSNGSALQLTGTISGGPTTATTYWVVNKAANTFQLATLPGGTGINKTSGGTQTPVVHMHDSALVSDAVYTNVPIRRIGYAIFNLSSPTTTWATATTLYAGTNVPIKRLRARYNTVAYTITSSQSDPTSWSATDEDATHLIYTGANSYMICPFGSNWAFQMNFAVPISATYAAGNVNVIAILKNGTAYTQQNIGAGGVESTMGMNIADTVYCSYGDYLQFQVSSAATSPVVAGGAARSFLSIVQTGE